MRFKYKFTSHFLNPNILHSEFRFGYPLRFHFQPNIQIPRFCTLDFSFAVLAQYSEFEIPTQHSNPNILHCEFNFDSISGFNPNT